jgi:hypothetical protein
MARDKSSGVKASAIVWLGESRPLRRELGTQKEYAAPFSTISTKLLNWDISRRRPRSGTYLLVFRRYGVLIYCIIAMP